MTRLGELTQQQIQARQSAGSDFMKFVGLLLKHTGKGGFAAAAEEAKRFGGLVERVMLAAVASGDTTSVGWASEVAAYAGLTRDWVFALTRTTVFGKVAAMAVPVPFLKKVVVETGDVSAGWVAAGGQIPMSKAVLSTPTMLQMKKVSALVGFTDEIFASWTPATESNIRNSIERALRYAMDFSLLDPSITETPDRPASLTNGIAPTQSTGATAAQALADFNALLGSLIVTKGADASRVLIAMSPVTALYLSQLLTTGGQFAFPNVNAANGGTLLGFPVALAHAAAQAASPSSSFAVGVDCSKILIADDFLIVADASSATSLQFSDAPSAGPASLVSLFQSHTRALRLQRYLNYQRATANAVAWFPTQY